MGQKTASIQEPEAHPISAADHAPHVEEPSVTMLDSFDLSTFRFGNGRRYIQIPASHPAVKELTNANVSPVGAIRDGEWVFLYDIRDWARTAVRQRSRSNCSPTVERGAVAN
jgi:hypothetical protein